MSTITDQIAAIISTKNQYADIVSARAILQNAAGNIDNWVAELNQIKTDGVFDAVPNETKAALNSALTALETCQTALDDQGIVDAIGA